jgi:hypothetical protein
VYEYEVTMEWYWQGSEELGDKSVTVPLCPQISHGLTRAWTRAPAVRSRSLTAWATILSPTLIQERKVQDFERTSCGHVAWLGEARNAYGILLAAPIRKQALERPRKEMGDWLWGSEVAGTVLGSCDWLWGSEVAGTVLASYRLWGSEVAGTVLGSCDWLWGSEVAGMS